MGLTIGVRGYGLRKELELESFQALDTLDVDGACDTL